jgi:hypothetical protein
MRQLVSELTGASNEADRANLYDGERRQERPIADMAQYTSRYDRYGESIEYQQDVGDNDKHY